MTYYVHVRDHGLFREVKTGATYRDEEVGHSSLILQPALTVLLAAAGDVSSGAVRNHTAEEEGVKPGEGAPILIISFCSQVQGQGAQG